MPKTRQKPDRKPLARYGARGRARSRLARSEGQNWTPIDPLARSLLTPAGQMPIDNDRRAEPTAPHCRRHQSGEDSAVTHAQDVTTRLTPIKFENIIDLATRGEPPLVAGFKS
jgi:hypothetical protein